MSRVQFMFLEHCRQNFSSHNLILGEKHENKFSKLAQQVFPVHKQYIFHSYYYTDLLSETTLSQAQPAFTCSNSAILRVE